ncbi:MAG: MaoC family dehydratase [Thermoanaerobaculia bacterium]
MAGHENEPSPWLEIDQERVNLFADATNDHQFIHVDPVQAAQTPFGSTVAHGYLTLSLLPFLSQQVAAVPEGLLMAVNYGLDKLRFPQPVKVGCEVRLRSQILEVAEKVPGRILVKTEAKVEIRGETKPALVAETLAMLVVGPSS